MADPRVTVLVVTYNSAGVIEELLASLEDASPEMPYELVVVDNASDDGTADLVRRLRPDADVINTGGNRGYAAGINAGLGRSTAPNILITNPDIRLGPGCIPALVEAANQPDAGIAAPRLVERDGRLSLSLRRDPTALRALGEALLGRSAGRVARLGEVVVDPDRYRHPGPAEWAVGALLLVTRRCIDQVGLWDETFFLYSEETDFQLRARDAGFTVVFEPAASAVHLGGDRTESASLWSLLVLNRVRFFRRRHGALHSAAFRAAVLLNEALRATKEPRHRAAMRSVLSGRAELLPRT